MARPTDLWAMALLLAVAAIVSAVAAESRHRARASRRAAEQAEALHALAHAIISGSPAAALLRASAGALAKIFDAPAIILEDSDGVLTKVASEGGKLSDADFEAAKWVAANGTPSRAETYPFDQSAYDFWPAVTASGRKLVMGVRFNTRPEKPERHIELVAGYLAAGAA